MIRDRLIHPRPRLRLERPSRFVLSLVLLSRGNEVVAMRACGASIIRVISPILIASFGIAILTFFANEYIVPYSNQRVNHIWQVRVKKISPRGYNRTNQIWYRSEDNTIWHISTFDPFKDRMKDVTLYRLDKNDRLFQRIDAQRARWVPTERATPAPAMRRPRGMLPVPQQAARPVTAGAEDVAIRAPRDGPAHSLPSGLASALMDPPRGMPSRCADRPGAKGA